MPEKLFAKESLVKLGILYEGEANLKHKLANLHFRILDDKTMCTKLR